jgi:glycerate 2-kinase
MSLPPSVPPDDATAQHMRSQAGDIFKAALSEATVETAFREHVHCERGVLRICQDLYDLSAQERVLVVGIGKASYAMARALQAQIGRRLEGIAAGPAPAPDSLPGFRVFCGGHPLPTAESIRAAEAILGALSALNGTSLVIFLVSGGGSAMVEKPAFDSISLADLVDTYNALVLSGATIVEINSIRKHLSAVKGGRMALAAAPARQVSVFVSDVPDNAPDSLASGPTMPDSSTVNDCYGLVQRLSLLPQLPAPVRDIFSRRMLPETPKADDPAFARSRWWTVLSNSLAQRHAAQAASRAGFAVQLDSSCDDWDYAAAADYLLERLRRLRQGASRVCLISGGEVTVRVTDGGRGGRNQQFALYCAQKIAGENMAVLSAGTDGIDGNTDAAGAVADGTTWARAVALGLDPAAALAGFDAYPLFRACNDLVITGATGNNVRDVRVLLAY